MGLITRFYGPDAKGSKLTIKEMDDNLYYLQSFGVTGVTYSSNVLTLTNPTGGTLSVNIENDVSGNMWFIPSGETVTIPSNIQNFIYGDLVVEGSLILEADSQLVVLNGDIILSGGTLTGDGTTYIIDLPETDLHVTSGTFNPTTKQITFVGNIGFTPFDVDLSSLSTDNFYLTAGTYNSLTESIDFSGNDPVTNFSVDVSQLLDDTNTYTTGATLNGPIVEFNRNDISNAYSVDLSSLEFSGAVTDNITITGDGTVGNPLEASFQSPQVDGVTITGDGTPGNPLVSVFQSPYVDGVTITGDGTPGNPLVAAGGSSGGKFGIADSNGAYTYYSTLDAAITAASSGQTIEFFTDYTETGAVTITLKDGVTINGNGHTYFHTQAGSANSFNTAGTGGNFDIFNLNITRTNATGGYVLVSGGGVYGTLESFYLNGSVITCNNSAIYTTAIYTTKKFYNANIILTGSGYGIIPQQIGEIYVYNFNVKSLSSSTAVCCYGALAYNSIFENEGSSTTLISQSKIYNCSVISRGSAYCISGGCSAYNSFFYSAAGSCTYVNNIEFNGCTFVSAGSYGVYTETPIPYRNCTVISTANIAAVNGSYSNSSIYSSVNIGTYINTGTLENCSVQSGWNNAGGHGFRTDLSTVPVTNCNIKVENSSANCLFASSAISVKYANNAFKGATTPVNANITQGISNTQDNQGNILI